MWKKIFLALLLPLIFASQVYFSPHGGIRTKIIDLLRTTSGDVNIAIFSFTSKEIALELYSQSSKGRKIRVLADSGQNKSEHSALWFLKDKIEVKTYPNKAGRGMMHNKFMVIGNKFITTGSYNWSNNAEDYNNENLLILEDLNLANKYLLEFEKLWLKGKPLK